jgi:SM-20-related protein
VAGSLDDRQFASRAGWGALSDSEARDVVDIAYSASGAPYSHIYETLSASDCQGGNFDSAKMCERFRAFLNEQQFLDFVRRVTGREHISAATTVACRYLPGHFYATHVDTIAGSTHRLSYVFNLTHRWNPQWGGILQFMGRDGNVMAGYVPRFNSLSLFVASLEHSVTFVAPFAPYARLSIAGGLSD